MKKLNITLLTAFAAAVAAVAQAAITGTVNVPGDHASSSVQTVNGVNTVDGGSRWTHNGNLLKIGNRTTGSLTASGGGWLEITAATVPDTYAFQVGNQAGGIAQALVTGAGSKVTTLTPIQVGRNESGCTLTIELGGLVVGQDVVLSRDSGLNNLLRMGLDGILAIEGTGKTLTSDFWSTGGTGEMQCNPSGDGTTWVNVTSGTAGVDYTIADGSGDLTGYSVLTMLGGTTPADPEITSLGGGNWELTLKGEPSTAYEFYSSTTLDFDTSTLVPLTTVILGSGGGTDAPLPPAATPPWRCPSATSAPSPPTSCTPKGRSAPDSILTAPLGSPQTWG